MMPGSGPLSEDDCQCNLCRGPGGKMQGRGITYLLSDTLSSEGDKHLPGWVAERAGAASVRLGGVLQAITPGTWKRHPLG